MRIAVSPKVHETLGASVCEWRILFSRSPPRAALFKLAHYPKRAQKGPPIGMEKGPLLIIGSGSSPESVGVHRGDPRVATGPPRGWRSVARGGGTCGPPGVNRGRGSAGGEARRLGTARRDTLACLERSSLEGQSRPNPRGGATLLRSERSSSRIAWRASASALSCQLSSRVAIASGRCFPSAFGMYVRRDGCGRYSTPVCLP